MAVTAWTRTVAWDVDITFNIDKWSPPIDYKIPKELTCATMNDRWKRDMPSKHDARQ